MPGIYQATTTQTNQEVPSPCTWRRCAPTPAGIPAGSSPNIMHPAPLPPLAGLFCTRVPRSGRGRPGCKPLGSAREHRGVCTQVPSLEHTDPGSSCRLHLRARTAHARPSALRSAAVRRTGGEAGAGPGAGRARSARRGARSGRKPREEGGRGRGPRRRACDVTALRPSPPNTLSSRPDPPSPTTCPRAPSRGAARSAGRRDAGMAL